MAILRGRHKLRRYFKLSIQKVAALSCMIITVMTMYFLIDFRDFSRDDFHTEEIASFSSRAKVTMTKIANIRKSQEIAKIEEHFISICLTWRTVLEWNFNSTTEKRIIALMRALSPAYVRIGGSASHYVHFQSREEEKSQPFGKKTLIISGEELDRINRIAESAGFKVIFSLNLLKRFMNSSWDPSNALRIMKYVALKGYKFGWQLGNEPNHLDPFGVTISPEQLAEDFKQLRGLLSNTAGVHNFLVGPEVTQPRGNAIEYLQSYYVRAEQCSLPQFYVPQTLDTLLQDIKEADEVISEYAPGLPRWFGETASVSGGGAAGISGRFVAGFLWLNKLGMAAQHGYEVVLRQTMFQGYYSLVGLEDMEPNPDYWLSFLHKKLLGTIVLEVKRDLYLPEMVRIFAYCTNTKSGLYKRGAITFMAMNLHPEREANVILNKSLQDHDIDEFLFTPDGDITSRRIKLNGKVLEMGSDSFLPSFQPIRIPRANRVILPPLTYAFYVVPEAHAKPCLESTKEQP
ncbi:heparanase-like [Stylophora pistillata]|uniref:heparanase-like n=1 Tax=Stylophora pistillata TaxID=50429 RepID=UPI000C054E98|nr:heparanase-like [Stylophora pistillata]